MLDQMQVVTPTPSRSFSPVPSYVIGPIDPAQVITLQARLSDGQEISPLIPVHLPPLVLNHPVFKEGYAWGYAAEADLEEEVEWTVPKLVNEVYQLLAEVCDESEPDFYPWTLGFLLGELARMAQRDRMLALTGLAHFAFLLSFIPLDAVLCWPAFCLLRVRYRHNDALRAYRARVRVYRAQGIGFLEAQRLALATPAQ
ncbi:MAG TPA: hypothetical protein VK140_16730 [Ktedonobacteraceae bacterium]|nr:hypothetical protein [Ktedonobacteraceae bacterium]